jgi:hypothetical protein
MANAAINVAIMAAAQQQAAGEQVIIDQLRTARAVNARAARPVDLSTKGSDKFLKALLKKGHVRPAGGGSYWLDEEEISRTTAAAGRIALLVLAFVVSAGASLLALTL